MMYTPTAKHAKNSKDCGVEYEGLKMLLEEAPCLLDV